MDQIKHSYIPVDGLKLHVAELGSESSPAVLFLHGFPEAWYTWRHQMVAVANAGFRAIAPEYRGYGLSDIPAEPEKTSFADLVKDTATILASLAISKVYVIGKDFGGMVAYIFALFFPEKVAGIITIGVPYLPPQALEQLRSLPEGFYMRRWQEPGRAEADFGRFDAKTVVRKIYILFCRSEVPIAGENQEIMDMVEASAPLPSWITEEDLEIYGALYEKSGFSTALQVPYSYIPVDGLKLHVAELGSESSPAVLFLHGFPEAWYTWRHQMVAVANAGFRAIAPEYRGYGLSDIPAEPEKTSFADLVKDTATILASLAISKVYVIGKDFGGMVAYIFALFFPEKVAGIITIGVPYLPPQALEQLRSLPEGFYMRRWQEPGRAEADFGRFDAKTVVRKIYILFCRSEVPIAGENQEIMDMVEASAPLPSWITEEDLEIYGALYEKSGFSTALQVPYRSMSEKVEPPNQDPNNLRVDVPAALFITGKDDFFFNIPGIEEYLKSGAKNYVPNLEITYIPEGSHFVQEQFPDKVNQLLLDFLNHNKY